MEITVPEQRILQLLQGYGALRKGHWVLRTDEVHTDIFVDMEQLLPYTDEVFRLADRLAIEFAARAIVPEVVLGPPGRAGCALALALAYCLSRRLARSVRCLTPTKQEFDPVGETAGFRRRPEDVAYTVRAADAHVLQGSHVALVDDVCSTADTFRRLTALLPQFHATALAAACIADRGGLEKFTEVTNRFHLTRVPNNRWHAPDHPIGGLRPCPRCAEGVPINTELGHGAEYLAKRKSR